MHVVPKAKLSPDDDDKTTLESQWEDEEASTTVEQGEVAEKIRTLGIEPVVPRRPVTGITHTGAGVGEESTVDDQGANADIVALEPQPPGAARMVITQCSDAGKDFGIDGAKVYTIGRALDNDIVLTDIAVSRKHFDLRFDAGAWVIVDHGSGNGTVVNGNLEDNPFMLANGDVIEIGNTSFRFEQEAADRARGSGQTFDVDVEADDEPSTIAGKPAFQKFATPTEQPTYATAPRPKTLPPPMPLRPRAATQPPPPPAFSLPPPPATTMPMPQMANRPPIAPAVAPTLLVSEPLGSTIPGQGPAALQAPAPPLFYPQATEIPPHSVHAQMLVVQAQTKRADGSTALVQPTPYGMLAQPQAARFAPPQLSHRTKLVLGIGALSLLAALTTIAVVRSGTSKAAEAKPAPKSTATVAPAPPPAPILAKQPDPPKPLAPPPVARPAPKPDAAPIAHRDPPRPPPPPELKPDPKPTTTVARRADPPKPDPKPEPRPDPRPANRRVATADDAREKADDFYKEKHFSQAANVLLAAAKSSDADQARDLRLKASRYAALAKTYNQGMAPGGDPGEVFDALRAANSYDQNVGGHFSDEISEKLKAIVPRAAVSFVASGELEKAHVAVLEAEQVGVGANSNIKAVRAKLEKEASDIYAQAVSAGLDTADGKDKLKRIKAIVDAKSPWYLKASRALAGV